MGTHVSIIFRGYSPYIGGVKPSFFMVLGSQGIDIHVVLFFLKHVVIFTPTWGKWSSFTNICSNGESISPFIGGYNPSYPCSIQFLGGKKQLHLFLLGVYRLVGLFWLFFWRSFANQFLGVPSCYQGDLEKRTSIRSDQKSTWSHATVDGGGNPAITSWGW